MKKKNSQIKFMNQSKSNNSKIYNFTQEQKKN